MKLSISSSLAISALCSRAFLTSKNIWYFLLNPHWMPTHHFYRNSHTPPLANLWRPRHRPHPTPPPPPNKDGTVSHISLFFWLIDHREPWSRKGSLSLVKHLLGMKPASFGSWVRHFNFHDSLSPRNILNSRRTTIPLAF